MRDLIQKLGAGAAQFFQRKPNQAERFDQPHSSSSQKLPPIAEIVARVRNDGRVSD